MGNTSGATAPTAGPRAGDFCSLLSAPPDWRHQHLSWPKLVRTPKGTIVLACCAGIGHNIGGSGPAVSISHDEGQSFSSPRMLRTFPDDDARYLDCGNLAMGLANDGAVVLLAMAFNKDVCNTIFGYRSTDGGRTWEPVDTAGLAESRTGSVYGHIMTLPDGRLAVAGHYRRSETDSPDQGLWLAYSEDDGGSWSGPRTIATDSYVEPAIIHTARGFVGLLRTDHGDSPYTHAVSADGHTWRFRPDALRAAKAGGRFPSPLLIADPSRPTRLWALNSIRHEEIALHTADLSEADDPFDASWQRLGQVIRWEGEPASGPSDWTYPWMTRLGDRRWLLAFYCGHRRGESSIYCMTLRFDAETGTATADQSV